MSSVADVISFGAVGNGVTDDLPAFNAAVSSLGANGGILTGPALKYRLNGTLDITTQVAVDFGTNSNASPSVGAILFSNTNLPILRYPTATNRFVQLRNISIVGTPAVGSNQHGIVINNGGVYASGFTIRDCSGHGLVVNNSYAGSFQNGYIQGCGGSGVYIDGGVGANVWQNVACAANAVHGYAFVSMTGSDYLLAPVAEQSGQFGFYVASGVKGCRVVFAFSERNTSGPLRFDSGSEENHFNFSSFGYSEPLNLSDLRNGTRNGYDGRQQGQVIRHMLTGSLGVGQIDSPAATLDAELGLAISGWNVLKWIGTGSTIQLGGVNAGQWTTVEMKASGSVKQSWS